MPDAKRKKIIIAAALLTTALLAGLIWQANSTRITAPAPSRQKITIATANLYLGSGLLYLAQSQGYFAQQGLDVTLAPYTSGRDALEAVIGKRVDLATSANIPIMFAAMQDHPVSIVATIFSARRDRGIVARHDRGISGLGDLKGKRVGLTLRSDSHFILSTMLARHQLTLDDVQIVSLGPDAMVEALRSGTVDAVSTWEPVLSEASQALAGNGSEFRIEGGALFDFNLVGEPAWTKANPDKLRNVLKALLMAKRYIDEHPQAAQKIILDSMKMDPAIFDAKEPRYRFVVQLEQNLLVMLEDETRWAIRAGLTNKTDMPDYLSGIDMKPLTAVKPEAVTIVR